MEFHWCGARRAERRNELDECCTLQVATIPCSVSMTGCFAGEGYREGLMGLALVCLQPAIQRGDNEQLMKSRNYCTAARDIVHKSTCS
jgi:hypothetical protein